MAHLGLLPRWRVPERNFGAVYGFEQHLARRADVSRSHDGLHAEFYDWGGARWTFRLQMLVQESEVPEFLGPLSAADQVDRFDLDIRALPLMAPARFAVFDARPKNAPASGVTTQRSYLNFDVPAPGFEYSAGARRIGGLWANYWADGHDWMLPISRTSVGSDLPADLILPAVGDFVRLGLRYAATRVPPPALPTAADSPYRNGWLAPGPNYDFGLYRVVQRETTQRISNSYNRALPQNNRLRSPFTSAVYLRPALRKVWRNLSTARNIDAFLNYNTGFLAFNAGVKQVVDFCNQAPFIDGERLSGSALPGLFPARLARPVKITRDKSMLAWRADITIVEDFPG